MTQFFHASYNSFKREILATNGKLYIIILLWSVSAHLFKWTKTLRKFSREKNLAESWGKYPVVSKSVEVLLTKIESTDNSAWLW